VDSIFHYFSVNPFGSRGTVREETAFVISEKCISRFNNEPITAGRAIVFPSQHRLFGTPPAIALAAK
jgi:hypothetical protein